MDRIINIKVGGNHLSKDSKNAGVKGEANVTKLRIAFDEGWDGYAKTVTFWDAYGKNPVKRLLTADLLEDRTESTRIFLAPIPAEPMAEAGMMTFVIDGFEGEFVKNADGDYEIAEGSKRQRSIADELEVKDSPVVAGKPTDPTPTQAEGLQLQIEAIIGDIQGAAIAEKNAKKSENNAEISEGNARESEKNAAGAAEAAGNAATFASERADEAREYAEKAEKATTRNAVIIDGYWWVWSAPHEAYINTDVRAQAGSEVYIGDNPPDSADIIIDLDGESAIYAPYIGENGNWYTFNPETQAFADSGNKAVAKDGYTPVKGEDYWTPEEEAEMRNSINSAVEDATASAEEAQKSAQQALADLLAMINGGDIILATNGKLPLSAIPATATQEIYTVSSEDELTSLTAQRGDLAELIEEVDGEQTITKTWQCLGDASVRENWVVWGTSYAVQSGNATTANNALNANMINNHRIVEMTEEEFASAVKDENTYYLVY